MCMATYLRRMLRKVLNFELSSGGFSTGAVAAPGVEALVEGAVEPGVRVLSGARSAMGDVVFAMLCTRDDERSKGNGPLV